jgi:uncharacterized membrane protein (UPF0182 family)
VSYHPLHWNTAGRQIRRFPSGRGLIWAVVVAVLLVLFVLSRTTGWLVEWLWMRTLGYADVFLHLLSIRLLLFAASFAVSFVYLWSNIALAGRNIMARYGVTSGEGLWFHTPRGREIRISPWWLRTPAVVAAALVSLSFGGFFYEQWDTWLRFRYGGAFGFLDPVYRTDVGFYVFRYPFYELLQGSLTGLTFLALAIGAILYVLSGAFRPGGGNRSILRHLVGMFLLFAAAWGWGYYLDRFGLLFSTRGVAYGAGYTDVNVMRIALWVMVFATLALAAAALASVFLGRFVLLAVAGGTYAALIGIVLFFLPSVIQRYEVKPNELALETPYIERTIDFTRRAYLLDRVETRRYPAVSGLTYQQARENKETLSNIRLWDWRPMLQTYRQTQEIRAYYRFYDVDVDRYHLEDGGYRQVLLSARELEERLPESARTWVNEHLQYTHGYGLAMSLASEKTDDGLPVYLIKDLPPNTAPALSVSQPAVYYGGKAPGYRIVSTNIHELDYPKGDQNVYTSYAGKGGILLGGVFKRLLFAWKFSDINILLSGYITPTSRIQLFRPTRERVSLIAPFLRLDDDPYLVVSGGKLYWIQDAYTVSSYFPYSAPFGSAFNYIRNSVKVVVDAYQGSVAFYVMDPKDPVLAAYRWAFPGVFKDLAEMSPDLKAHLRYPESLFRIQAQMYATYHMTVPQVFYNKEDLWSVPNEKYGGSTVTMEPYYILMRLPEEKTLEYLIMTPMTPSNRDNMIAWLAGRCDFPEYGHLIEYQLPKEKLIYGPLQIEAMIDQTTVISQQLSLWDQRGSRVIRGNLLVIPLDHSFLYVEPVYLLAEETNIPQLRRVIAVYGQRVAMEPTLEGAIRAVFAVPSPGEAQAVPATPSRPEEGLGVPAKALGTARKLFEQAEDALKKGEWEKFGQAMEKLGEYLRK